MEEEVKTCKACGHRGTGTYCSHCSQAYQLKRISLRILIIDFIQSFANLESGFLYTLKQLMLRPGHMQWEFIHQNRIKYQKPLSFLLICATLAALARYWIYSQTGFPASDEEISEAVFFREYWTLLHIGLLPVYILITYLVFIRSDYNYAEVGVMMIYLFAQLFIITAVVSSFRFIWPTVDTLWFELLFLWC